MTNLIGAYICRNIYLGIHAYIYITGMGFCQTGASRNARAGRLCYGNVMPSDCVNVIMVIWNIFGHQCRIEVIAAFHSSVLFLDDFGKDYMQWPS